MALRLFVPAACALLALAACGRGGERVADTPERAAGALSGIVIDYHNEILAGARIELWEADTLLGSTESDAAGNYRLEFPGGGARRVRASAPGHDSHEEELSCAEGQAHELTICLVARTPRTVTVVDRQGSPIAGARLSLFGKEDTAARLVVVTDAEGVARFDASGADAWLLVEAPGCASEGFDLKEGALSDPIRLCPGGAVAGVVVDAEGRPLPGAQIEYYAGLVQYATTDGKGAFRLEALELCPSEFTVWADGYAWTSVEANPGDEEVRVVLERHGALRGQVLLPDGAPASWARVSVPYSDVAEIVCDEAGLFHLEGLPPRPLRLRILGARQPEDGALSCEQEVAIPGGGTAEVAFTLGERRYSHLNLQVLDPEGEPAAQWRFALRLGTEKSWGKTDDDGACPLRCSSPPGTEVTALFGDELRRGLAHWQTPLVTAAAEWSPPQVVRLVAPPTFDVVARGPGGEPLSAQFYAGAGLDHVADADGRARFAFDPARATCVSFSVRAPGYAGHDEAHDRPPVAGEEFEVRLLPGATASGRVVGTEGELAAWALCVGANPRWIDGGTSGDAFTLSELPPGPFLLFVQPGTAPRECVGRFRVRQGERLELGEITTPRPLRVSGRVVRDDGRGLGGTEIKVGACFDGEALAGASHFTSADGSFTVPVTSTGTPLLLFSKRGFATHGIKVADGRSPLVTLKPGTSFRLKVFYDPADEFGEGTFRLHDPATGIRWIPREGERRERKESVEWRYLDLPTGPLAATFAIGERCHTLTVEVLPDGAGSATLDLSR